MITTKELQYVELWANKIPMPGVEYSLEIMKEIEACYKLYNNYYKDKEYNFLLFQITANIQSKTESRNTKDKTLKIHKVS